MPGKPFEFIRTLSADEIPADVKSVLRRSFVDTLGVAAAGATTDLSGIVRLFASRFWCASRTGQGARMLFDGRHVSAPGAAFAGAFTVDSIDGHDGYSGVKGHAGSAVMPSVLAVCDSLRSGGRRIGGEDLLVALAIGYEVAYRAGLALHGTAPDYHTSGAWTAVGVAAATSRLLRLSAEQTRHAVGIAEYHGPRSQMMRCIDHPTMLRDGVGWGAPSGVSAAYMAELGFTGAPAVTVEGEEAQPWWASLGSAWEILETHYKLYPVCRWAHPAIDGALALIAEHGLSADNVQRVRIRTFHYATRLAGYDPKTPDEIAYSIVFPVAAAIVRGTFGLDELQPSALEHPAIRRLCANTDLVESAHLTEISVKKRWADVTLFLKDGRELESAPRSARGDPDDPLTDEELDRKYRRFAEPALGRDRAAEIQALGRQFDSLPAKDLERLCNLLATSIQAHPEAIGSARVGAS